MVLASGLLLLFLVPGALATGHFAVRLRISSISQQPIQTTLSIYGMEKAVTVSRTTFVTLDYTLDREHLVRDKPHLLTITSSSTDGIIKEEMQLRRFARSAHTVSGRLRIISEPVECQKNFYGPFCWVECVISPGNGLVCDSEGVPRCRKPGCTEHSQKKTHTLPCQNGECNSATGPLDNPHVSEEIIKKQGHAYSVTFETPISTNLLLVLNALLCLIVLGVGIVLICIGLRLRSITTDGSSLVNAQVHEQLHSNDSMSSTPSEYDLVRFSPARSDDLAGENAAKENAINKKIELFHNEHPSETENIYEIV